MSIEFTLRDGSANRPKPSGESCNVVIAGNFSGTAAAGSNSDETRVLEIDPFDVDAAISRLAPEIRIEAEAAAVNLRPQVMDDFQPDNLYRAGDLFRSLDELVRALSDPKRAASAIAMAEELTGLGLPVNPPAPAPASAEEPDMFTRLLGRRRGGSTKAGALVDQLVADAVKEDAVSTPDASISRLRDGLHELTQTAMREILRHPVFCTVESAWRSVEWFAQQAETEEELKIWLVDTAGRDASTWAPAALTALRGRLFDQPICLLAVLSDFSDDDKSIQQLTSLAELSTALNCPVMAGADARLAGLKDAVSNYFSVDASDITGEQPEAFRQLRAASGAALALGFPRLLLRQPFGQRSNPVESFPFEELESSPDHDAFCWGSSAIALAAIYLARREDEDSEPRLDDLPLVVYDDGSGQAIKPATEVYLSDSADAALRANGITPLVSKRGETSIWITELQGVSL